MKSLFDVREVAPNEFFVRKTDLTLAPKDTIWYGQPMSVNGDTMRTDGTLLYSYARKGGGGSYVINGVEFTAFNDGSDFKNESKNPNVHIEPDTFDWTEGLNNEGLTGDYGDMLNNAFNNTFSGERTITLKNLTIGQKYLMQVVAHNNRGDGHVPYAVTETASGESVMVNGTDWRYGGTLIGEFVATSDRFSFTLDYDGMFVLNAIQVRKL